MDLEWRVTIPSTQGGFIVILDDEELWKTHGEVMDEQNINTARSLILAWISLLSDNPMGEFPRDVLHRFTRTLELNLFGTIRQYSDLADLLMKSEQRSPDASTVRTYIKGFEKTPVFRAYLEWFRSGDPVLMRWLLSVLSFGKVANFDRPELEPAAFEAWLKDEVTLGIATKAGGFPPAFLSNMRRVLGWLLLGYSTDKTAFTPHHGRGFTAERVGRGINAKNDAMTLHRASHREYFEQCSCSLYPDFRGYYDFCEIPAELTFVPKNYKSLRTICMEPVSVMYAMQGVRDQLYRFFRVSCIIRMFIDLQDQARNQLAALAGSKTGEIDTIDLSRASDLVLWILVVSTFPPNLLVDLYSTRSSKVRYKNHVYDLHKFAPMGSALCFPVQCLMFLAIVLVEGISQAFGTSPWTQEIPASEDVWTLFNWCFDSGRANRKFSFPTIYGDDICLDTRQTKGVMLLLEQAGFVVNSDKSFTGTETFRESCGKFYSNGHDVSMLKYRGSYSSSGIIDVATLAGLIDQSNRALDFGYYNLRRWFVRLCLYSDVDKLAPGKGRRNPVLFSNDEDTSLAIRFDPTTKNPNSHLVRTKNTRYQLSGLNSVGVVPSCREVHDPEYDNYGYLQWQRAQWYGKDDPPNWEGTVRADYRDVVPVMRWTRVTGP